MKAPKATEVKRGISVIRENLQCPICLDLLNMPISTKCDHQFCRFCMMKLLDRKKEANCPVCKAKVTKRSLQESPGFQRLVEGLQHMVQAYEEDTSTDYFAGASERLEYPGFQKADPREMQCNRGKTLSFHSQGVESADSSQYRGLKEARNSLSSVEAEHGFAKLMDLEDSCTVILDKEGSNGGLPDMPKASEMKMDDKCMANTSYLETPGPSVELSTPLGGDIIKTRKTRRTRRTRKAKSHDASQGLEEVPKKADRLPHGAATMMGADHEYIIDKRCKRSLQKVSEWLLKISPMDVEEDSDGSVSDGGSSFSTVKENKDEEQPLTLRRNDHNKSLEAQVFGVVYGRAQKSVGNQLNRTLPPESRGVTSLPACHLAEIVPNQTVASQRRRSSRLAPAGFDKLEHTEEKEETIVSKSECNESTMEPVKAQTAGDRPKEEVHQTELCSQGSYRKKMDQVDLPEQEDIAVDSPVFEVSLKRTAKRAESIVGSAWKEVEDFRLDGKGESGNEKLNKRKSECRKKENHLTRMRLAKVAKPLDLVSSGMDKNDYTVRLEKRPLFVETEFQIESYPSSEGQGSPAARITRQTKRLQAFTEEVQGTGKKARAVGSTKNVIPHLDKANAGEKAEFVRMVGRAECAKRKIIKDNLLRNGCIVDGVLENIEKIESIVCEDMEVVYGQKKSPTKNSFSLSAIPNAESSSDVIMKDSTLQGVHQASQSSQPHSQEDVLEIHSSVENFACKVIEVHGDVDEKNDSEQDTEQLLKTFKTTKRRSFQLGFPSPITSNRSSMYCDKQNEEGAPKIDFVNEEMNPYRDLEPCCPMETVKQAEVLQNQGALSFGMPSPSICGKNVENSLCSSLIPPTNLSTQNLHKSLPLNKSCILAGENSNEMFEVCSDTGKGSEAKPTGQSANDAISADRKRNSKTSPKLSGSSQMVDSVLLIPTLVASEEEHKESASAISNMPVEEVGSSKSLNCISEHSQNSGVFKKGLVGSACPVGDSVEDSTQGSHGLHYRRPAIKLPNSGTDRALESSMTPDDLLTPNAVVSAPTECIFNAGPSEGAQNVKGITQWSGEGGPALRKRKRPQRLESSASDGSDEEDQLPSLVQLFGQSKSKKPCDEKSILVNGDCPPVHSQACAGDPVRGAAVELNVAGGNTSLACHLEWVPASQGSVDLFDTPEEFEGMSDDRGHSVESSQFSNEIIATQQKVAMQEELRRLEEMMALVSEALHKKVDASQVQVTRGLASPQPPSSAGLRGQDCEPCPPSCDQTGEGPTTRKSLPPSAPSPVSSPKARSLRRRRSCFSLLPTPGAPAGASPAQPGSVQDEGRVQAGRRCGKSRSLRSSGAKGGSAASMEPLMQDGAVQTHRAAASRCEDRGSPPSVTSSSHARRATARGKMLLVASGLSGAELSLVRKFSKKTGGSLSTQVTPETTHVIIKTDENLVCERTLKYFLGIAARKWVVSFQWLVECFNHGRVLNEAAFEVRGDVVNGQRHLGPMKARSAGDQELLMKGYEICFQGAFTDMTTGQMEWMAELCGAKVVKDPLLFTGQQTSAQLVVVQPDSLTDYTALQKRAVVVSRGWLLDSVATYTFQNTEEYRL